MTRPPASSLRPFATLLCIFCFCITLGVGSLHGQIVIRSNDVATTGDNALLGRLQGTGLFNPALTGPNVVWDLSQQIPDTQFVRSYVPAFQTPYPVSLLVNPSAAPTFLLSYATTANDIQLNFNRAVAPGLPFNIGIALGSVYEFYNKNQSRMDIRFRGFTIQGIPLLLFYDKFDTLFNFPLEYGDSHTSTFAFKFLEPTNNIVVEASGTRTTVVDAWGTVILPIGTFPAIRVRSTITTNYTLTLSQLGFPINIPFPFIDSEVRLLSNEKKLPLVYATGNQPLIGAAVYDQLEFQDIDRRPEADFEALMPTTGCRPLTTLFQDRSTGATTVTWNFGDGNTSNLRRPLHTYKTKGKFSVTLTARNQFGSRSITKTNLVEVDPFTVNFNVDNPIINDPVGLVQFRNLTSETQPGHYTYLWDFGNGYFSSERAPLYVYTQPGIYSVRLIGVNPNGCHDTLQRVNYIRFNVPSAVNPDAADAQWLRAFPNPAGATLTLELAQPLTGPANVSLSDVTGRVVWTGALAADATNPFHLTLPRPEGLAAGLYQLLLRTVTGESATIRVAFQ